jgi:hypothetical protein
MAKFPHFPNWIPDIECEIIDRILTAAIQRDLLISVNDGEENVVVYSQDKKLLQSEIGQTDVTILRISDCDRSWFGSITLIHGNEGHVICDYTDHEPMEELLAVAHAYIKAEGW